MRYPTWLDEIDTNNTQVEVVGVGFYCKFDNLGLARVLFPNLDPFSSSVGFTWGMRGEIAGKVAIRFESNAAYNVLSV